MLPFTCWVHPPSHLLLRVRRLRRHAGSLSPIDRSGRRCSDLSTVIVAGCTKIALEGVINLTRMSKRLQVPLLLSLILRESDELTRWLFCTDSRCGRGGQRPHHPQPLLRRTQPVRTTEALRCSIHGFGFSLLASSDSLSNQWLNSVNFDRCKGITNGFLRGTTKPPYSLRNTCVSSVDRWFAQNCSALCPARCAPTWHRSRCATARSSSTASSKR